MILITEDIVAKVDILSLVTLSRLRSIILSKDNGMDFAEASVVDNLLIAEVDDEIGANVVEDDMLVVAPDGNTDIS